MKATVINGTATSRIRQHHGPVATIVAALEACLWSGSLIALGLAGWMWADCQWFQARANSELASLSESHGEPVLDTPAKPSPVLPGTPIARLEIPRLKTDPMVIAEGASAEILRRAVGHLAWTARPGDALGNVVLAGHRDTFFRPLEEVRTGDLLVLESPSGRYVYEVEWTKVVDPTAIEVAEETLYPALTLITCYPFRYIGRAPQRFVVRARRLETSLV